MMNLFKKMNLLPEPPERTARFELRFPESRIKEINQLCIDCNAESPAQVFFIGLELVKRLVDAEKNNRQFVIVDKDTADSSMLIYAISGQNIKEFRKELKSLASKLNKTEGQVITDALNYYNNSLKEYEDEHNL
jgi:hypothetical protein